MVGQAKIPKKSMRPSYLFIVYSFATLTASIAIGIVLVDVTPSFLQVGDGNTPLLLKTRYHNPTKRGVLQLRGFFDRCSAPGDVLSLSRQSFRSDGSSSTSPSYIDFETVDAIRVIITINDKLYSAVSDEANASYILISASCNGTVSSNTVRVNILREDIEVAPPGEKIQY